MPEENRYCVRIFVKQPSRTRSGTIYTSAVKTCSKFDQQVFGSISPSSIADELPHKAKTISRKVKVLCLCKNCTKPNKVIPLLNNKSGVIFVQINDQFQLIPAKSTGIQTEIPFKKPKLFCGFRKPIGVRQLNRGSSSENEKEIQAFKLRTYESMWKLHGIGLSAKRIKSKHTKKEFLLRRLSLTQNCFVQNRNKKRKTLKESRKQKHKGKSLLKYVLKKEAIKKLSNNQTTDSSDEDNHKLQCRQNEKKLCLNKKIRRGRKCNKSIYITKQCNPIKINISNSNFRILIKRKLVRNFYKNNHHKTQ